MSRFQGVDIIDESVTPTPPRRTSRFAGVDILDDEPIQQPATRQFLDNFGTRFDADLPANFTPPTVGGFDPRLIEFARNNPDTQINLSNLNQQTAPGTLPESFRAPASTPRPPAAEDAAVLDFVRRIRAGETVGPFGGEGTPLPAPNQQRADLPDPDAIGQDFESISAVANDPEFDTLLQEFGIDGSNPFVFLTDLLRQEVPAGFDPVDLAELRANGLTAQNAGLFASLDIAHKRAQGEEVGPGRQAAIFDIYKRLSGRTDTGGVDHFQNILRDRREAREQTVGGRLENFGVSFTQGITNLPVGALGLVAPETANEVRDDIGFTLNPDLTTPSGIAGGLAAEGTTIAGTFGLGGSVGLASSLAARSAGNVRQEVADLRAQGQDISGLREAGTAVTVGGSEFLSGLVGGQIFNRLGKLFRSTPGLRSALSRGEPGAIKQVTSRVLTGSGLALAEGVEEQVTQIVTNKIRQGIDPEVALSDGIQEAFVAGVILSPVGGGVSRSRSQQLPFRRNRAVDQEQAVDTAITPTPAQSTESVTQNTDIDKDAEADAVIEEATPGDRRQTTEPVEADRRSGRERRSVDLEAERNEITRLSQEGNTEALDAKIREIQLRGVKDPLGSGLNSKNTFDARLEDTHADIVDGEAAPREVAFIDLGNLNLGNSVLGHPAMDGIIADTGAVLSDVVGEDAGYRNGGDEFTIIFPEGTTREQAEQQLAEVEQRIGHTELVDGASVFLAGAIGTLDGSEAPSTLLTRLDKESEARKNQIKTDRGQDPNLSKTEAVRRFKEQQAKEQGRALDQQEATQPADTPVEAQPTPKLAEDAARAGSALTGVSQEATKQLREELGLREFTEPHNPETHEQWRQEAIAQGIPAQVPQLAREVIDGSRRLTPVDRAGFAIYVRQQRDTLDDLGNQIDDSTDLAEQQQLQGQRNEINQELTLIFDALEGADSKDVGRNLQSRQVLFEKDYSHQDVLRRAKIAKGEEALSSEESANLEEKTEAHRRTKRKVQKAKTQQERTDAQRSLKKPGEKQRRARKKKGRKAKLPRSTEELDLALAELSPDDPLFIGKVALNRAEHPAHNQSYESIVEATQAYVKKIRPDKLGPVTPPVIDDAVYRVLVEDRNNTRNETRNLLAEFRQVVTGRTGLRGDIEQLHQELETGWWRKRFNGKATTTEAIRILDDVKKKLTRERNLRRKLDQLQNQRDAAAAGEQAPLASPLPNEETDPNLARIEEQIADTRNQLRLHEKIRIAKAKLESGVFDPPTLKEVKKSREVELLEAELGILQSEIDQTIEALRPTNHFNTLLNALSLPTSTAATLDASFFSIQNAFLLMTRPRQALRALAATVPVSFNARKVQAAYDAMHRDPQFLQMQRVGLDFSGNQSQVIDRDPEFASDLLTRVPVLGRVHAVSQNLFNLYMDTVRFTAFKTFARADGGEISDARAKTYADFLNVVTRRADLGHRDSDHGRVLRGVAASGNLVFFSTRNWISQLQTIAHWPVIKAAARKDRRGTVMLLREYAKYYAAAALMFALWDMFFGDVELDPRSPGFTRLKWLDAAGVEQDFDITGQLGGEVSFWTQMFSGTTKTKSGEIRALNHPEWGQKSTDDLIGRKIRGKLNPINGHLWSYFSDENFDRSPFNLVSDTLNLLVPLSPRDIKTAFEQTAPETKIINSLLAFFGNRPRSSDEEEFRAKWEEWNIDKRDRREALLE